MENSLKQRIIGAVVLAALAVIFLPTILKEKSSHGEFESRIPSKPKVLEEYRVDKQKIEKLVQDKDKLQITKTEADKSNDQLPVSGEEPAIPDSGSLANAEVSSTGSRKTKTSAQTMNDAKGAKDVAETSNPILDKESSSVVKTVESAKSLTESQNKPEHPQKISSKFSSAAWVVQVASFSTESNATKMVSKLKSNDFKAYPRRSVADGKVVHRVFVGPYVNKEQANRATSTISMVSETSVVLRPFDPTKH